MAAEGLRGECFCALGSAAARSRDLSLSPGEGQAGTRLSSLARLHPPHRRLTWELDKLVARGGFMPETDGISLGGWSPLKILGSFFSKPQVCLPSPPAHTWGCVIIPMWPFSPSELSPVHPGLSLHTQVTADRSQDGHRQGRQCWHLGPLPGDP